MVRPEAEAVRAAPEGVPHDDGGDATRDQHAMTLSPGPLQNVVHRVVLVAPNCPKISSHIATIGYGGEVTTRCTLRGADPGESLGIPLDDANALLGDPRHGHPEPHHD